jgi:hypothetical protein
MPMSNRSHTSLIALLGLVGVTALALATGSRALSLLTLALAVGGVLLALPAVLLARLLGAIAKAPPPARRREGRDERHRVAPTLSLVVGSRVEPLANRNWT